MKILHTADWHLGAFLGSYSRLEEQELFIGELCGICKEEDVGVVIIAGDVFDTKNPSSGAEKLFYSAVKRLSEGERAVLIIAGNHDNPEKLSAARVWAYSNGAVISGFPLDVADDGDYGYFRVLGSREAYYEIEIRGERAAVVALPYANEARLSKLFPGGGARRNYSREIGALLSERAGLFRDDTVNIVIGHMFIAGARASERESDIVVGGSYAADASALPDGADYIALGHLHRRQRAAKKRAYYSGSPLQYSLSEISAPKCVLIADIDKKTGRNDVSRRYLKCLRPMRVINAESIDEALEKCAEAGEESYVYLNIRSDRALLNSERRALYAGARIVDLNLIKTSGDFPEPAPEQERGGTENFADYYKYKNGREPSDALLKLFSDIFSETEEEL